MDTFTKTLISLKPFTIHAISIFSLLLVFSANSFSQEASPKEIKTIAISQIVEHASLDATREGILSALKEAGYSEGKNLKILYENAQGNLPTAVQIAKKLVNLRPDVIVAISTPSAQAVVSSAKDTNIPVVFAAVSDPLSAKLVTNLKKPGSNVTGVMDGQPIGKQLVLIKKILPNAKKIGVLYNPGEINSVKILENLKNLNSSFEFHEAVASKSSEVLTALQNLIDDVDAIYIPLDNTIVSALPAVLTAAFKAKKPVFSTDPDLVKQGVLASFGSSYEDLGRMAGEVCADILQGKFPGDIEVSNPKSQELYLNLNSAEKLGIEIPAKLIKEAKFKF